MSVRYKPNPRTNNNGGHLSGARQQAGRTMELNRMLMTGEEITRIPRGVRNGFYGAVPFTNIFIDDQCVVPGLSWIHLQFDISCRRRRFRSGEASLQIPRQRPRRPLASGARRAAQAQLTPSEDLHWHSAGGRLWRFVAASHM